MWLYIVRHGKAERDSRSGRDEDRTLTDRGRRQADWLGQTLAERGIARVLSSPAARAAETAGLIAERAGLEVEPHEGLGLGSTPGRVLDEVLPALTEEPTALVGHNPTLSDLVCLLVGGVGACGSLDLRTGQAAVLAVPDPASPTGACELADLLRLDRARGG